MKDKIICFLPNRKSKVSTMCKTLKKIKGKTAIELLEEFCVGCEPPIDIIGLARKIGIMTIPKDFSKIEEIQEVETGTILGATFSLGDDLAIFYRPEDSFHRQKFTIAHELAHCCNDCPKDEAVHIEYRLKPYICLDKDILEKERRANIFAGELLIPKDGLMKIYNQLIIPSLTDLAKIFDVSTSVMAARLDYLKLPYYKDCTTENIL